MLLRDSLPGSVKVLKKKNTRSVPFVGKLLSPVSLLCTKICQARDKLSLLLIVLQTIIILLLTFFFGPKFVIRVTFPVDDISSLFKLIVNCRRHYSALRFVVTTLSEIHNLYLFIVFGTAQSIESRVAKNIFISYILIGQFRQPGLAGGFKNQL